MNPYEGVIPNEDEGIAEIKVFEELNEAQKNKLNEWIESHKNKYFIVMNTKALGGIEKDAISEFREFLKSIGINKFNIEY